jgi:hypothetical protein
MQRISGCVASWEGITHKDKKKKRACLGLRRENNQIFPLSNIEKNKQQT